MRGGGGGKEEEGGGEEREEGGGGIPWKVQKFVEHLLSPIAHNL